MPRPVTHNHSRQVPQAGTLASRSQSEPERQVHAEGFKLQEELAKRRPDLVEAASLHCSMQDHTVPKLAKNQDGSIGGAWAPSVPEGYRGIEFTGDNGVHF